MSRDIPLEACIGCGRPVNSAANPQAPEATPAPGEFSVCVECSEITVFNEKLQRVRPTAADMATLTAEEKLDLMQVVTTVRKHSRMLQKMLGHTPANVMVNCEICGDERPFDKLDATTGVYRCSDRPRCMTPRRPGPQA